MAEKPTGKRSLTKILTIAVLTLSLAILFISSGLLLFSISNRKQKACSTIKS